MPWELTLSLLRASSDELKIEGNSKKINKGHTNEGAPVGQVAVVEAPDLFCNHSPMDQDQWRVSSKSLYFKLIRLGHVQFLQNSS